MKITLFTLMLALQSLACFAQRRCANDSLEDHTPLTIAMDTTAPPCYPFDCYQPQECHSVNLQDSLIGVVEFSNSGEYFEILVLDDCHWVVHDTCVRIGSTTPGFAFFNTFPANASIIVCGQSGSTVTIFGKSTPTMGYPSFGSPTIDLDTLCGLFVSIQPMQQPKQHIPMYWQHDGYGWKVTEGLKPSGQFKSL